ncbi:hypothetical protein PILCRDRAFT_173243 [Piloderma croceum F 1598]|uniref:Uncharacterized protein n=1 Tax=Piloderma croceum (strain F 1598) TaxID=765440 RepID=A0A0C3GEN3_PILCF|nr:hypothetical protein PILCRDRAFT_173243 [Piloderma croceum F 1598]
MTMRAKRSTSLSRWTLLIMTTIRSNASGESKARSSMPSKTSVKAISRQSGGHNSSMLGRLKRSQTSCAFAAVDSMAKRTSFSTRRNRYFCGQVSIYHTPRLKF